MQFEDLALKKAEPGQITPFSLFHGWEIYLNTIKHYDEQKHPSEKFYEKRVLKNFAKFTEKHLCQVSS